MVDASADTKRHMPQHPFLGKVGGVEPRFNHAYPCLNTHRVNLHVPTRGWGGQCSCPAKAKSALMTHSWRA